MKSLNDEPEAKATLPSPIHDMVTGGIEGGVGTLAIDPLFKKIAGEAVENPFRKGVGKRLAVGAGVGVAATGLIGALVSAGGRKARDKAAARRQRRAPVDMEALAPGMIEFGFDEGVPRGKNVKNRRIATTAGLVALAGGIATVPAARKLIGIKVRNVGAANLGLKSAMKNIGGKTVADYISGAQEGLNRGLKGKLVGHVIEHALAHPEGKVAGAFKAVPGQMGSGVLGQRLSTEHFARFRSSPMSALHFWDYEHSLLTTAKIAKQDAAAAAAGREISPHLAARRKKLADEHHYGREKAHAAIKEQVEVHGKNEMDAIKTVAYHHSDPQVQGYFKRLADTKSGAVDMYAKKALVSPALIAAGTGGIVYGRDRKQTPGQALKSKVRLEAFQPILTLLERYDSSNARSLRSGVRLDKYEKSIRANEIDRHVHNYLVGGALGAIAGTAIPGARSLKVKAGIGAGVGVAGAGLLHVIGHRDEYGEQSEEAKIAQRNVPKYAAVATVIGGLLARARKKGIK